ncbi:hypothetical protein BDY19DRAFT_196177 [Irpex rosettiformis]|uniref:Uncharacterized protein n=1 Tax=Irpex rosettiformis TaxID=378272 RepID=A0ACB8U293_9APHY|nr:hypothetical protein BDY19DRAFT_196177 [Irpex rosettiformis]
MLPLGRSALRHIASKTSYKTSYTRITRQLSQAITKVNETKEGIEYQGHYFPYLWLRDSCQCPHCVHPSTKQKLNRSSDACPDSQPKVLENTKEGVKITWRSGHESIFPPSFLERYSSSSARHDFHGDVGPVSWNRDTLQKSPALFVEYEDLRRPEGLLRAMTQVVQYGLLFVRGVPNQETSNEACELRKLAGVFGEIRETFYGPLWDVVNLRNSTNIAYTNLFLDLHMDLLYFQHPPRYQFLHCLRNRVNGGSSVVVDALHAAQHLRTINPSAFNILATVPTHFHYINNGEHYHQSHPTIELDHDSSSVEKPIKFVNYSPPFQAPLSPSTPEEFYHALSAFVGLLEGPGAKFEYLLREGDVMMFDNRRVLHARTAFTDKEGDGKTNGKEPNRWLKGCYLEADALLSRRRSLLASAKNN